MERTMYRRIGIVTLLRHRNPGTYFQALGTYQALQGAFPESRVEFADLTTHPRRLFGRQDVLRCISSLRHGRYLWHYWKVWHDLPRSQRSLATQDRGRARAFIEAQEYDLVVLGSDVVLKIAGADLAGSEPPVYWLPPLTDARKVMFGSSCDTTRSGSIPSAQLPLVTASALTFDRCYVRDDVTAQLLGELGVEQGRLRVIPDPAFSIHLSERLTEQARVVLEGRVGPRRRPRLGLNLGGNVTPWKVALVQQLKSAGFEVLSLRDFPGTRFLGTLAPWEWVGVFPCFDVILTYSFHETLFCLRYGVPVVNIAATERIVEPSTGWSKGKYLLSQFGLASTHHLGLPGSESVAWGDVGQYVKRAVETFSRQDAIGRSQSLGRAYEDAVRSLKEVLSAG